MPRDEQYLVEIVEAAAAAFRNVAVHEYFAIEWMRFLSIARNSTPEFAARTLDVLRVEFPEIAARVDAEG